MSNDRHKILPEEFLDLIENHKGPARVEINTGYRKARFDAIPQGNTLKIVCEIDIPGDLPDSAEISGFITSMVHAMMDIAVGGGYTRMEFDVPSFGERMILSLDDQGEAHLSNETIGGGLSCN